MKAESVIKLRNLNKSFSVKGSRTVHALKNINLDIRKGECVGIVGENGSGKSTLLRIMGGITKPSSGTVQVRGRVAPVLSLMLGFDPYFPASYNAFLYGALLGITKKKMKTLYEDIVRFSGLEGFMDMPLGKFSDGMILRLGFSVAVNADADIMLIDEVIAVGDGAFQSKCLRAIDELKKNGKTIVIVSHSLDQIQELCNRIIFLGKGEVIKEGETEEVINTYRNYLNFTFWNQELLELNKGVNEIKLFGTDVKSTKSGKSIKSVKRIQDERYVFSVDEDILAKCACKTGNTRLEFISDGNPEERFIFYINERTHKNLYSISPSKFMSNNFYVYLYKKHRRVNHTPLRTRILNEKAKAVIHPGDTFIMQDPTSPFSEQFEDGRYWAFGNRKNIERAIEDYRNANGHTIPVVFARGFFETREFLPRIKAFKIDRMKIKRTTLQALKISYKKYLSIKGIDEDADRINQHYLPKLNSRGISVKILGNYKAIVNDSIITVKSEAEGLNKDAVLKVYYVIDGTLARELKPFKVEGSTVSFKIRSDDLGAGRYFIKLYQNNIDIFKKDKIRVVVL